MSQTFSYMPSLNRPNTIRTHNGVRYILAGIAHYDKREMWLQEGSIEMGLFYIQDINVSFGLPDVLLTKAAKMTSSLTGLADDGIQMIGSKTWYEYDQGHKRVKSMDVSIKVKFNGGISRNDEEEWIKLFKTIAEKMSKEIVYELHTQEHGPVWSQSDDQGAPDEVS